MSDEDDFLSRWSRRKRAIEAEDAPQLPVDVSAEVATESENEEEEEAILERLGLPVPETLKKGDDFSVFLADGVPKFLRRRALRVLWRSNPVLANIDGLNDYDDDFNSPELTQKVLATGYKVGRGFVRQILDVDEETAGPTDDEAVAEVRSDQDEPIPEEPEVLALHDEPSPDEDEQPMRPRRMQFTT